MPQTPEEQKTDSKRLPFEPGQHKKKPEKKRSEKKQPEKSKTENKKPSHSPEPSAQKATSAASRKRRSSSGIPDVVSKRMIRRMAVFCGVPTFLGVSSFFVSYFIVVNELFELPNTAVLFVSLGFFGIGVLGLSYGALSTSWDEDNPGGLAGIDEFKVNLGRMQQAWRDAREQAQSK